MRRIAFRIAITLAVSSLCGIGWLLLPQRADYVRKLRNDIAVQSGDVILFGASSWRGRLLKILDRGSVYAHAGIADKEGDVVYLIHADPCRGKVIRETVDAYLSSNKVERVMVMRADTAGRYAMKAIDYAQSQWRKSCPFNNSFRYGEGEGLYCTELVMRAWFAAGVVLLPHVRCGDRVFPSALLESHRLKRIAEYFGSTVVTNWSGLYP